MKRGFLTTIFDNLLRPELLEENLQRAVDEDWQGRESELGRLYEDDYHGSDERVSYWANQMLRHRSTEEPDNTLVDRNCFVPLRALCRCYYMEKGRFLDPWQFIRIVIGSNKVRFGVKAIIVNGMLHIVSIKDETQFNYK